MSPTEIQQINDQLIGLNFSLQSENKKYKILFYLFLILFIILLFICLYVSIILVIEKNKQINNILLVIELYNKNIDKMIQYLEKNKFNIGELME